MVLTGVNEITNTSDMLFIIERVNEGLNSATLDNGDIVMEGVCAVFGTKNNNNRIYEKAEYLPHLDYLNEKIERGQLFGELDHPQNFDVSLKNVSHVVEKLWYDQNSDNVKIKVRLLNTPAGQIAKTLVESGCTISTSSRAAGQVMNEGKVKIQRIFTYDLVAEPGFSEAVLRRSVNESFQSNYSMLFESLDNIKSTSIINKLVDISESLNLEESIKVYKINNEEIVNTMENNNKHMANEFVTKEAFNQYSELVKSKFDALKESVDKMVDGFAVTEDDQEVDPTLVEDPNAEKEEETPTTNEQLVEYVNYLSSELSKVIEYNNYLSGMMNKSINYSEHVAEKVNKVIDYSDYLAEKVEQGIGYTEYVAENLNGSIDYSEHIAENVNKNIKYTEYLAENLDKGIAYSEYLGENLDKGIAYTEYVAEKLNNGIEYSEYLGESLNKSIEYSDYLAENLNRGLDYSEYLAEKVKRSISYSEYIAENVNNGTMNKTESLRESVDLSAQAGLNESGFAGDYTNLSSQIDNLIESVKTQKTESNINEASRNVEAPADTQKAETLNEEDNTNKTGLKFIDEMPEEYTQVWESLTESHQQSIVAQSNFYRLDTPYQIKNFWSTRQLGTKTVGVQKLDESENVAQTNANQAYSSDYMNYIASALEQKFARR